METSEGNVGAVGVDRDREKLLEAGERRVVTEKKRCGILRGGILGGQGDNDVPGVIGGGVQGEDRCTEFCCGRGPVKNCHGDLQNIPCCRAYKHVNLSKRGDGLVLVRVELALLLQLW